MSFSGDMIEKQACEAMALGASSPHALPLRKRLELQKARHQEQIERLNALLALLDANPAIEQFQDLSSTIIF